MPKKRKPAPRSLGILPGQWFALLHDPKDLPVIFRTRQGAAESRLPLEYMVEVYIHAVRPAEVRKARRWELQQAKARPRKTAEQKRRRGSVA